MRTQTFGVEIEMTGITRRTAAKVIAKYFGTNETDFIGGSYDTEIAIDRQGRRWKCMRDASIRTERKSQGRIVQGDSRHSTEVVTPILHYDDLKDLQEVLRQLRHKGAIVNGSCGIHIHIGAAGFTTTTLKNLVNTIASKEDILYRALKVGEAREHFCRKTNRQLVQTINRIRSLSMREFEDAWYAQAPHEGRRNHYNGSRYHGLNLHAFYTKGTIEYRLFNSTLHAGELKAYIQFCLALTHKAKTSRKALARRTESDNEKYAMRCWLLRLGLNGDEFKTCRHHLLKHLSGNSAWRHVS